MYITRDIAERIKNTVISQNKTIGGMLDDLSMGINTLSQFSKGKQISCIALARIADYLDVSVDYLLGRTDKPEVNR